MKALKVAANQTGKRYAIVPMKGAYWVWTECKNYDGSCHGGMRTSWRYCARDLTLDQAEKLLARKIKGKAH